MSMEDATQYLNPQDLIWDTYLKDAKDEDETRPKNWEGSTNGILTFTGLFAATVAAFIIESYKLLSIDSGDQTATLLTQLLAATANASSNTPVIITPPEPFSTPSTAIVTNAFWFSSLLISLICALLSTLIQEWARAYAQDINRRKVLYEDIQTRAFNHIYIRMGVNRYGMDQFVSGIVALVHLSVFLFACGLLVFLFPISPIIAGVSTGIFGLFALIYGAASLLPLLDQSCPYRTPVTYLMAFVYWLLLQSRTTYTRSAHIGSEEGMKYHQIIARQYSGYARQYLTASRFIFALQHIYRHIHPKRYQEFFLVLLRLLESIDMQPDHLSRLCAENDLMSRLWMYVKISYSRMVFPDPPRVDYDIYKLVALLSERMFASEVEHSGEHLDESRFTSPWVIYIIGHISLIADVCGPAQLSAQLCLAYIRHSLLNLSSKAFEKNLSPLNNEQMPHFVHGLGAYDATFRLGSHNPSGLLLTLITGPPYGGRGEHHQDESSLVPLHEDDCCRVLSNALTPEDLAHLAACNALTVIAHILNSSSDQRQHAINVLFRAFDNIVNSELMRGLSNIGNQKKRPSHKFVSILHNAHLDEWLRPGSTFDTEPRDGPNREFLTEDTAGRSCTDALRRLATYVDFAAYRAAYPTTELTVPRDDSAPDKRDSPRACSVQKPGGVNVIKEDMRDGYGEGVQEGAVPSGPTWKATSIPLDAEQVPTQYGDIGMLGRTFGVAAPTPLEVDGREFEQLPGSLNSPGLQSVLVDSEYGSRAAKEGGGETANAPSPIITLANINAEDTKGKRNKRGET